MSETREKEIIEGTVEDIRFRNEQNGYTVLSVGCDDDLITAVGVFSDISVGESFRVNGLITQPSAGNLRWRRLNAICRQQPNSFIIILPQAQ